MAGRIDNIDAMIFPKTSDGSRCDGDASLLFLDHPVHRRVAFMHFADFVDFPGVKEDTLGGSRLTGIDMSHDANIAKCRKLGLFHRHGKTNQSRREQATVKKLP